jgi:vitamin B12 transporter
MLRVKSNECNRIAANAVSNFIPAFYSFFNPLKPLKMKKEKKVWALTLLAFWSLSPNLTNAQQDDSLSVRTLDELTITGTRTEQPIIEVPRSVSVITREFLEKSVYNSVADVLSAEAGIYIVGTTQTPGTNQSIFMRGANSNQVVVMIDGMKVSDPSSPNGAVDFSEISLTDVERIEVIRGPHSTLYGGSAIGGAINIITRKGGGEGFHGTASLQGGTYGHGSIASSGSINAGYKARGGWYLNGSIFRQKVDGLNATEDTITTADVYKTADKDQFDKMDSYLKTGYTGNGWDLFVAGKISDQRADIDDRAYDDDDNAYLDFKRHLLEYSATYNLNTDFKLSLNGSYSQSRRYTENDSSLVSNANKYDGTYLDGTYRSRVLTNEVVLNYSHQNVKATLGVGDYREKMDFQTFYFSNAFGFPYESEVNYDTIDVNASTSYAFGQIGVDLNNLNVRAGARFNHHSIAGDFFTFEVSPSYRLKNTLLYTSLSTGYNAPSLYQMFDPTFSSSPDITRGNHDLQAERSLSLEIGIKKEFNNGSYFTVAGYSSSITNDIEYVYLWNEEVPVDELTFMDYIGDTYLNISKQVVSGIEVSGRWNLKKFYFLGNISALKGKVTVDPADASASETGGHLVQLYNYGSFLDEHITVNSLARRPKFNAYAEAGVKLTPRLTIYSALRHAGSRNDVEYVSDAGPFGALGEKSVKEYNLWDMGANYELTKNFSVNIKVENLANAQYREIYGFQTRGRSGYAKLIFKW